MTKKFYQEMSQMSIVRESDDHETFEPISLLESYLKEIDELEYIEYKKETYGKKWCERED